MKTLAQLRPAKTGLGGQRWLLYGPPKIGKSTFASEAPGAPLFLDCEDGLNFLDAYSLPCHSWAAAMAAIDLISKSSHEHKTIVIDTVDRFVSMASEHVVASLNATSKTQAETIGDFGFGKGYARLREVLDAAMYKLAGQGRLIIFLSHEHEKNEEGKPPVLRPSVSRTQQVLGFCDVIGHIELGNNGERRIRFRATPGVVAGARGKGGSPLLPAVLPLSWPAILEHLAKPAEAKPTASTTEKEATK